jgi:hypothetical protein
MPETAKNGSHVIPGTGPPCDGMRGPAGVCFPTDPRVKEGLHKSSAAMLGNGVKH